MKTKLAIRLLRFCFSSLTILREVATRLYIENQDQVDELIDEMEREQAESTTTPRQEFRKHYARRRQSVLNHQKSASSPSLSARSLDVQNHTRSSSDNTLSNIAQKLADEDGSNLAEDDLTQLEAQTLADLSPKHQRDTLKQKLKQWFVENASHQVKHEEEFFSLNWVRVEDSDSNIQFNDISHMPMKDANSTFTARFETIKLATFDKMLERLVFTKDKQTEAYKDIKDIVFATYTSLVNSDVFLEKLGSIYIMHAKQDSEEASFVTSSIAELITYWITHFYYDLNHDTICRLIKFSTCLEDMRSAKQQDAASAFDEESSPLDTDHVFMIRRVLFTKIFETKNPRVPTSYPFAVSWEQRIALETPPAAAAPILVQQAAAPAAASKEEENDEDDEEEATVDNENHPNNDAKNNDEEEEEAEDDDDEAADNEEGEEDEAVEEEEEEPEEDNEPQFPEDWDPSQEDTTPMILLTWPTREIARQITLIEQGLFKSIQPCELLNNNYSMKHMDSRAPNLATMIHRFNNLSKWVIRTILQVENVEERAAHVEYFIDLLEDLISLGNYSSVMAIYGALTQAPIHRLKLTWELVSGDHSDILEMLCELLSPTKKFKNLRDAIDQSTPPCIPYMGVFLGDLATSDGVSQDFVNDLINVNKKRVCTKVIRLIQSYQNHTYEFQPIGYLQRFFKTDLYKNIWSDDHEYQISLVLEPKKTKQQQQS